MATKYLTNGDDYWVGTDRADIVFGRGGNDTIYGEAGNDTIYGDAGSDRLYGGRGNDHLNGGKGSDYLYGNDGDDFLEGNAGVDQLFGGDGNDTIVNLEGSHDLLSGGNGNDRLYGINCTAYGNAGSDFLETHSPAVDAEPGVTSTILNGGRGSDTFEVSLTQRDNVDIVIIEDFSPEDDHLTFSSSDSSDPLTILGDGSVASGSLADYDIQQVGYDLVFLVNGSDHDQLILKGAADWLHLT